MSWVVCECGDVFCCEECGKAFHRHHDLFACGYADAEIDEPCECTGCGKESPITGENR